VERFLRWIPGVGAALGFLLGLLLSAFALRSTLAESLTASDLRRPLLLAWLSSLCGAALGWVWERMQRKDASGPSASGSVALRATAALAAALLCAGSAWVLARGRSERWNVVWIVLDTLRADHLSCYGYSRPTSPFIDSLAASGTLFENAISQESYTLASAASYFTSQYPPRTGVLYGQPDMDKLGAEYTTVAEVFRSAGYSTAAFVFNPHLQSKYNFDQGFELYDDSVRSYYKKDPAPQHERFETGVKMLGKLESYFKAPVRKPVFLYLHYRDVHGPYVPPPPYHERFLPDRYPAEVDIVYHRDKEYPYIPEHRDLYVSQYDGEILYNDECLARAFTVLAEQGIDARNTIFVLCADHGEEFYEEHPGDSQGVNHGRALFIEQIHVPLIFAGPGIAAGARVDRFVELVDIAPTLLELNGLEVPEQYQGRSLVPALRSETLESRPVFSGGNRGRGVVIDEGWSLYRFERSVKDEGVNFHHRPGPDEAARIGEDLYAIHADRGQRENRIGEQAERANLLRAKLDEWLDQKPLGEAERAPLSAEERQALEELGYIPDEEEPPPGSGPK
jgi:arylsulfatase